MRQLVGLLLAVSVSVAGAQELQPWRGGAAPPLEIRDLEGAQHRLQDYRGKVVLVNFWATWCDPCREEMPSISKLRASLAGRPFVVLAVNIAEPESRIRRFLEQVPMDFTVLLDRDTKVAKTWRARILPASYLVDPGGRIRYTVLGEVDWTQEKLRKLIVEMLPPAKGN